MRYSRPIFVAVDIKSPNSATRSSSCKDPPQLPSSQTRALQRLCMRIMRGPAINHIQDTIVQLRFISNRVGTLSTRPPRYARFRRREESRCSQGAHETKRVKCTRMPPPSSNHTLRTIVTAAESATIFHHPTILKSLTSWLWLRPPWPSLRVLPLL